MINISKIILGNYWGILAFICLVLLSFHGPLQAQVVECDVALQALNEASEIRKLSIKQDVPCVVQGKKEVESYLLGIIDEQLPPEKLKNEELVYKKIGLLPNDFEYKSGIVELYLSQLGGYYDPVKDRFIMAGWLPANLQKGIAAHELTHALQDQYYDLKRLIDPLKQSGDTVLAHSALVEGDATAVMFDYERRKNQEPALAKVSDISKILQINNIPPSDGNAKIPYSLQSILIFPYTAGLNFVHTILKEGGYEKLKQVYAKPPHTTEEVIHVEKYFSGKKDYIEIAEAEMRSGIDPAYEIIYQDTIGEFGLTALLSMFNKDLNSAKKASEGWGGDRIMLFSKGSEKILIWKINWDSKPDLSEFKALYKPEGFSIVESGTMLEYRLNF